MLWLRGNKSQMMSLVSFGVCMMISLYLLLQILFWFKSVQASNDILKEVRTKVNTGIEFSNNLDKSVVSHKDPPFLVVDFTHLKKRNSDIVAWLKVGSVGIDMPIMQTTNNDFYLDHDLDKKSNKLGWVFADTRSNTEQLGMNTVLYGHNALNHQMFGSLKGLLDTTAGTKTEAELIQLTTLNFQMVFEICSVHVTDDDDWKYVKQVFTSDQDKKDFIDRMRDMNEMKVFNRDNLSINDKFLTFSTCYGAAGTTKRLVVHARLVAENE